MKAVEGKLQVPPSKQYLKQEVENIIAACNNLGERIAASKIFAVEPIAKWQQGSRTESYLIRGFIDRLQPAEREQLGGAIVRIHDESEIDETALQTFALAVTGELLNEGEVSLSDIANPDLDAGKKRKILSYKDSARMNVFRRCFYSALSFVAGAIVGGIGLFKFGHSDQIYSTEFLLAAATTLIFGMNFDALKNIWNSLGQSAQELVEKYTKT